MADVLGGGQGGTLGATTPPVSSDISSHVVAIATFGDPRHVASGPRFNKGTSTLNGLYPRSSSQVSALNAFASKYQAYCDASDLFCASGLDLTTHLTYLNRYQSTAANFVLGKIGG